MVSDKEVLLLRDEIYRVTGSAMEVLNTLGTGCWKSLMRTRWSWNLDRARFLTDSSRASMSSTKP
jgi:hypothetical protein